MIRADVQATWDALIGLFEARRRSRPWLAAVTIVGGLPAVSNRRPLDQLGAELPGFEVCELDPPNLLAVRGWHHFAAYLVRHRLSEEGPGRTRLTVESEAMFPGRMGALYGKLVVGTGIHVLSVKGILRDVRRRAE